MLEVRCLRGGSCEKIRWLSLAVSSFAFCEGLRCESRNEDPWLNEHVFVESYLVEFASSYAHWLYHRFECRVIRCVWPYFKWIVVYVLNGLVTQKLFLGPTIFKARIQVFILFIFFKLICYDDERLLSITAAIDDDWVRGCTEEGVFYFPDLFYFYIYR